MDNQHSEIIGHRNLTDDEIQSINLVKNMAHAIGGTIEAIAQRPGTDQRWISIAKTDLQKGLMSLTRSVAKSTSF